MNDRDPSRERPPTGGSKRSGGSDAESERSIFEILDAPLPSEVERERRAGEASRPPAQTSPRYDTPAGSQQRRPIKSDPAASVSYVDPPSDSEQLPPLSRSTRRSAVAKDKPRRRQVAPTTRRVRRTIKHVDPMSVLKLSLIFYTLFLLVWLLMVALFYNFLEGLGLFDQLESLGRDLVLPALQNDITLGQVERWAAVIGVIGVIGGSLVNAFLAFLYNVVSDLVGGLTVTFQERNE